MARGSLEQNRSTGTRKMREGYTQEEGIDYDEVFALVTRIEAIRLFLAYASFKDFIVYQMNVKSAFLYGKIEEEVYVYQPPGFEDPEFPNKVYKVEKALYGLHQALRAWSTRNEMCTEFEKMMHKKFQMSSTGELTFFLRLQVTQKDDGIFISQNKYVDEIVKKFGFSTMKIASTPMETLKPLLKDAEAEDVNVHLYRSMIGSLMYLTTSGPDIMFIVCACARFQVTPKVSHLHVVKRIFRYLKCQPKLGLWYPKDSPFDLGAYTNNDYAGASLDRKSTIGDENFIKEWEDRMERAITTATSLEVEQDSGNINRTQSMATLNESFPQGTSSGSGPRCQDTILGDAEAQISINLLLPVLVHAAWHSLTAVRHKLMLPIITYYCWATAKAKTVNGERQIQALMDKKKVIITETSVRSDLQLDDAKVFLDKQVKGMSKHKETYATPSHTKKVFANMKREGKGFSGRITPLFETMMVQAPEDMGEGLATPTDPYPTPIITQPSSSKPQKKQLRRKQRKDNRPTDLITDEATNEEHVSTPSYDPPQSGEDRMQLNELMDLYTKLSDKVLALENTNTSQAAEIATLNELREK
ncbi:putative ribonuclease H-like domain-containing protein [Tanacetum coccineum]